MPVKEKEQVDIESRDLFYRGQWMLTRNALSSDLFKYGSGNESCSH